MQKWPGPDICLDLWAYSQTVSIFSGINDTYLKCLSNNPVIYLFIYLCFFNLSSYSWKMCQVAWLGWLSWGDSTNWNNFPGKFIRYFEGIHSIAMHFLGVVLGFSAVKYVKCIKIFLHLKHSSKHWWKKHAYISIPHWLGQTSGVSL